MWYSLFENLVLGPRGKIFCYVDSLGSRLGSTVVFATARLVGLTKGAKAGGFMWFFWFFFIISQNNFGFNLQD